VNRILFLVYGIATYVLALSGLFYAIGAVDVAAARKAADVVENSFWPVVLLSAFVLVTGIAAQHHLVAQLGKRPPFQDRVYEYSLANSYRCNCCLGLLVSLYAAIYGWDLSGGLP